MGKKRGRNRKNTTRTASGQLSRAKIDTGCDRVAARFALYGTDGSDALGRAYQSKLLGSDDTAKALLDAGRALHRAYWAAMPGGADQRAGKGGLPDNERILKRERWLVAQLDTVARRGNGARRVFDSLVIDVHPDSGPVWLDRIIARVADDRDADCFRVALDALHELAGI